MGYLDERLVWHPTPSFSTIHEENNYLDREEKRINEGFMNLSGLHYFHLSKIKIIPIKGAPISPKYSDTDEKMLNAFLWCINYKDEIDPDTGKVRLGWDLDIIKRRRAHFTTLFGGTIPCWLAIADKYRGSTYPITSCDSTRLIDLINLKLKPAVNSCVQEGYLPENHFSNSELMRFVPKTNPHLYGTTVYFLDTSKDDRSAAKAEGTGNIAYLIDERFLHPKEEKVKMSFDATLNDDDGRKVGIGITGGSANAFTKGSTEKLKNVLKAAKEEDSHIKMLFIAGWDGLVKYPDGTTNKQAGIDLMMEKRAKFKKSEQWDKLANEIKSYPLTMDELISSVESDYFSPFIMHNISKGKMFFVNNTHYELNLLNQNGSVFDTTDPIREPNLILPPDPIDPNSTRKFPYTVFKKPIEGHTYIAGLDPIDFAGASAKGSLFSCVIKDITTNEYVASLEFRTTDPELGYNLWYNFLYWYKSKRYPMGALCLGEKNKLSSLLTSCQMKGTLNLLARDPAKISSGFQFKDDMDRGYHKATGVDGGTMNILMIHMKNYLQHNIVPFANFNETFVNYDPEKDLKKSDICDAVMSCEYLSNFLYKGGQETTEKKYRREEVAFRDKYGNMDTRIINVPIN
jgi:hypothetical protein